MSYDVVVFLVPAYLALQVWAIVTWKGGWRLAALLPLIAFGLVLVATLIALNKGSNMWPLLAILYPALGFIYLALVAGVRALVLATSTR